MDFLPNPFYSGVTPALDEEAIRCIQLDAEFKGHKDNLIRRAELISASKRKLELSEELQDIKYYLDVMKDPEPTRNFGADFIQGFINKIYDLERKNPMISFLPDTETSPVSVSTSNDNHSVSICDDSKEEILPWGKSFDPAKCTFESWSHPTSEDFPKSTRPTQDGENTQTPSWFADSGEQTDPKSDSGERDAEPKSSACQQDPQTVPNKPIQKMETTEQHASLTDPREQSKNEVPDVQNISPKYTALEQESNPAPHEPKEERKTPEQPALLTDPRQQRKENTIPDEWNPPKATPWRNQLHQPPTPRRPPVYDTTEWFQQPNIGDADDVISAAGIGNLVERRPRKPDVIPMPPFCRTPSQAAPRPQFPPQQPSWYNGAYQPLTFNPRFGGPRMHSPIRAPIHQIPRERIVSRTYVPNYGHLEFSMPPEPVTSTPVSSFPQQMYPSGFQDPLYGTAHPIYDPLQRPVRYHASPAPAAAGYFGSDPAYGPPSQVRRDRPYNEDNIPQMDNIMETSYDDYNHEPAPPARVASGSNQKNPRPYVAPGRSRYFNDPRIDNVKKPAQKSFGNRPLPRGVKPKQTPLGKLREKLTKENFGVFKLGQSKLIQQNLSDTSPERFTPSPGENSSDSSNTVTSTEKSKESQSDKLGIIKEILKMPLTKRSRDQLLKNPDKLSKLVDDLMSQNDGDSNDAEKADKNPRKMTKEDRSKKTNAQETKDGKGKHSKRRDKRSKIGSISDSDSASTTSSNGRPTGSSSGSPGKTKKTADLASNSARILRSAEKKKKADSQTSKKEVPANKSRKRSKPLVLETESEEDGGKSLPDSTSKPINEPIVRKKLTNKEIIQKAAAEMVGENGIKYGDKLEKRNKNPFKPRISKDGRQIVGPNDIIVCKGVPKVGLVKLEKVEPSDEQPDEGDNEGYDPFYNSASTQCEVVMKDADHNERPDVCFTSADADVILQTVTEEFEIADNENVIMETDAGDNDDEVGDESEDGFNWPTVVATSGHVASAQEREEGSCQPQENGDKHEESKLSLEDELENLISRPGSEENVADGESGLQRGPNELLEPMDDMAFQGFCHDDD